MRRLGALIIAVLLVLGLAPAAGAGGDPRWVFYTKDKTRYTSPWFHGGHRIMIPFGCTSAPYYSPDPRCSDGRGFHHGLDIAMECGTPLYARFRARVVSNDSLGSAYGVNPVLLRNRKRHFDLVIGHTEKVYVREGQVVRAGTMFARANDSGAPDGCHLHFEQRAVGGGLSTAVWPRKLLDLTPRRR
ncbi:M23 family metallopeptidase [Nocardioides caricicola]|uniref:M23 family metallopeptidase n=1 Tax=Nocardioides caricicola TaxID=634770 RepID=A0ABW0N359_9ACTN